MEYFTISAWVLAHRALIVKYSMSKAPSNEIKDEPQSGAGCRAAAFMNARAELLLFILLVAVKSVAVKSLLKP